MLQDLAALAPPAIVCVAFLVGAWVLVRRELAPKRRRAASTRHAAVDGASDKEPAARADEVAEAARKTADAEPPGARQHRRS